MINEKLKPKVKALWLEALRSGVYEQTNMYLSRNGKYCCLGVLCELAVAGDVATRIGDNTVTYVGIASVDASSKILPNSVTTWAGLLSENPTIYIYADDIPEDRIGTFATLSRPRLTDDGKTFYATTLAELNDTYHFTFSEIADVVEKYL